MTEKYTREEHEAYRAGVDAEQAKEEQERRERMDKAAAKRAWIADGGSVKDFERAWPRVRDEARAERIKSADRQAREQMREGSRI